MNAILKYITTILGLSFAIWMMTSGSYNLYQKHLASWQAKGDQNQIQISKPPSPKPDSLMVREPNNLILQGN